MSPSFRKRIRLNTAFALGTSAALLGTGALIAPAAHAQGGDHAWSIPVAEVRPDGSPDRSTPKDQGELPLGPRRLDLDIQYGGWIYDTEVEERFCLTGEHYNSKFEPQTVTFRNHSDISIFITPDPEDEKCFSVRTQEDAGLPQYGWDNDGTVDSFPVVASVNLNNPPVGVRPTIEAVVVDSYLGVSEPTPTGVTWLHVMDEETHEYAYDPSIVTLGTPKNVTPELTEGEAVDGVQFEVIPGETPTWLTVADPATGEVTINATESDREGLTKTEFNEFPVLARYPDGSSEKVMVPVKFRHPANDHTYPSTVLAQGESETATPTAQGNSDSPVTFSREVSGEGTNPLPDWVSIDPSTGELSINPPKDAPVGPNTYHVTTTQDGVSKTVPVEIEVTERLIDVQDVTPGVGLGAPGSSGTLSIPQPVMDEGDEVPEDIWYEFATGSNRWNPAWADHLSINRETGQITFTNLPTDPNFSTEDPELWTIPVKIHNPSGSVKAFTFLNKLNIRPTKLQVLPVVADTTTVQQGNTESTELDAMAKLDPEEPRKKLPLSDASIRDRIGDLKVTPSEDFPSWATYDPETHTVTANPGTDVEPGEYTYDFSFQYGDDQDPVRRAPYEGTEATEVTPLKGTFPVKIVVTSNMAAAYDPQYPDQTMRQGESADFPAPTGEVAPDGDAVYSKTEDAPEWVTINSEDGSVTATTTDDQEPGDYDVPVNVQYSDGTSEVVTFKITVVPSDANTHTPVYADGNRVVRGETATVEAPTSDPDLPAGTTFEAAEGTPEWVTVNEDGTLDLNPSLTEELGPHTVPVKVNYPDGSSEVVDAYAIVDPNNAADHNPAYQEDNNVRPGTSITVPTPTDPNKDLPEGTTYSPDTSSGTIPEWVTVNEDGTIVANPPAGTPEGTITIPVTVHYPDVTTEVINAPITVLPPLADDTDPIYAEGTEVYQGNTKEIDAPKGVPDGSSIEPAEEGVPEWATVHEDGSITVSPDTSVTPGDYTVPVVVTYPDGSKDTVNVPVKVLSNTAASVDPSYEDTVIRHGQKKTVAAPVQSPAGSTYAEDPENPLPEWVTVNEDGTLDLTPGTDVTPGDHTVYVKVTYPDGTSDVVPAKITVKTDQASATDVIYPEKSTVVQGTSESTEPLNKNDFPEGTTFEAAPNVNERLPWVAVGNKGTLVLTPGTDIDTGLYEVPIVVNFPDGTSKTVKAPVEVLPAPQNTQYDPAYKKPVLVESGDSKDSEVPVNQEDTGDFPEGTKFTIEEGDAPKWVSVNPKTGVVTANPPEGTEAGDTNVTVTVTYPDETTDTAPVVVKVFVPEVDPTTEPSLSESPTSESEEPTSTSEEPTSTSEEPTSTSEEPTSTSEEPTSTSEEPTSTSEEPTSVSEEPTSTSEEPTSTSEEPTSTSEEPTSTSEEPTSTSEEPTSTSEEPTSTSEEPTSTSEESTSTSEEPTTSVSVEPTSVSNEPTTTPSEPTQGTSTPAPVHVNLPPIVTQTKVDNPAPHTVNKPASTRTSLAHTGANVQALLGIAFLMMLAGLGSLVFWRRSKGTNS